MSLILDRPKEPELLSPAGDWEAMRAAVANGADAVYFGLSSFNARHRAANFRAEELPAIIEYLHGHNVRGYLALNTLIFSDELPAAVAFVRAAAESGVDALIVQDLGLARLIHRLAPRMPIHGSTQMTLTEPRGIEFVRGLGVQRVILARELSVHQIAQITAATDVPVEAFVHGALCISYSGQCLTSEALGGRSANRGQCAQACRLPYELIVDGQKRDLGEKAYLLSPQDLASHDMIDQLLAGGVCSLKIEGRLKSAQYVAAATQTYRAALDAARRREKFTLGTRESQDLAQSFSRGFSHGFLSGVNHQELVPARFPKSRGLRLGVVTGRTARGLVMECEGPAVKPGDGVVFDQGHPEQDEQGGRVFAVEPAPAPAPGSGSRSGNGSGRGTRVELIFGRGDVQLEAVEAGNIVWKTDDPAVRRRLEQSYSREKVVARTPLDFTVNACAGKPLELIARDAQGVEASLVSEQPLEAAVKHALDEALLREQLGRLGQTPFVLGSVTLNMAMESPVMAPKSLLNDLRRRVVDSLLAKRDRLSRKPVEDADALDHCRGEALRLSRRAAPQPRLYVMARDDEQLDAVLAWSPAGDGPAIKAAAVYLDFEDVRRYRAAVARCRAAGMPVVLATTRVCLPGEDGLMGQIAACEPDGVLIRNLAGLSFFRERFPAIPGVGDYSLNVANELTAHLLAEQGLARLVPSYDLNWKQLGAMLARVSPGLFEAVIHQHMPMFHMEHCVIAATLSNGKDHRDCGRPCDRHRTALRDRAGADHALIADVGCRNTVFNAAAQSAAEFVPEMLRLGLRHFRIELLRETPEQVGPLLTRYARVLAGLDDGRTTWRQLRVLNQLGVTRGTLEMA